MKTTVGITCKVRLHEMKQLNWGEAVWQVSLYISAGTICVPPITFGPKKVWSDGPADKLTIVEISLHTLKADWMRVKERYIALFVSGIFMGVHAKTAESQQKAIDAIQAGSKSRPLLLAGCFFSHGDCVMFLGSTPGLAWRLWHCASDQSVSLRLGTLNQSSLWALPFSFFGGSGVMLTSLGYKMKEEL